MFTDLSQLTVSENEKLIDAMKKIGSRSERILFVVNDDMKLVGTITDGDIRRAIIRKIDTEIKVSEVMCSDPTISDENYTKQSLIEVMTKKKILVIPIIDNSQKLIGYESILDLSKSKKLENPVLIMAGGFGMRMRPLTNNTPKPMLKISGQPVLEKLIIQLAENGFTNIYISIHYKGSVIEDYFKSGEDWGIKITYIYEDEPLGTGGSLNLLPDDAKNGLPILIVNSDLITTLDYSNLLDFHRESKSEITICIREYENIIPYGVIEMSNDYVTEIIEKPAQKYFINGGIYALNPSVFRRLEMLDKRLDMPFLINYMAGKGDAISVFPVHEYWMDIGKLEDYNQAELDSKSEDM